MHTLMMSSSYYRHRLLEKFVSLESRIVVHQSRILYLCQKTESQLLNSFDECGFTYMDIICFGYCP